MMKFGSNQDILAQDKWRSQLEQFVNKHEQQLAALAWGLQQEWGENSNYTLGIDLIPQPHFVACSKPAIETLNEKTSGHLQEILGLIDGYKPETEVLILAIAEGQIKLIYFQPEPSPPTCFQEVQEELDALIQLLEASLERQISLT